MNKAVPMEYLQIMTFNQKWSIFKNYDEKYVAGTLSESEIIDYFWSLKSLLFFYCKRIKYIYKKRKIYLHTPVEILTQAGKEGIITDSEIWLEYIKWVNRCLGIKDVEFGKKQMLATVAEFRTKIDMMLIFIKSPENLKLMEDNDALYQELIHTKPVLADNKPIYSNEELKITERSYQVLLDFFKSYPQIKGVWLHGSRAYGTSDAGSDLDLIFDCELSVWDEVRKKFSTLLVPYYIDGKNVRAKETAEFVNLVVPYGTKKIYDSADFQIFWDDTKPYSNGYIKVDITKALF